MRADGPLQKKGIAERLGCEPDDRSFKRALKHGKDKELLVSPRHGRYAVGAAAPTSRESSF
ncbi:MAG: hypothetical protein M3P39_05800 [Actinomycetota bacterium]|nr:hypothetical protein [Actinomycetota bacterium]